MTVAVTVAILVGAGAGYLYGSGIRATTPTAGTEGCSGTPVQFQAIPVNFTHMPVLLMQPNTSAVVCVTYRDGWDGNSTQFSYWSSDWSGPFHFPTSISKAACTATPEMSGCFYSDSHSFDVVAFPNPIQPSATVAEVTVNYSVYSLPNATGFYDRSFIFACEPPRLAVGYSAQQVNSSDFATIIGHSCPNLAYTPVSITVSGMNVTYVEINASGR